MICDYHTPETELQYRVTLVVADPGWVDFDLGCSINLFRCPASSAKLPTALAVLGRQWDIKVQVSPT